MAQSLFNNESVYEVHHMEGRGTNIIFVDELTCEILIYNFFDTWGN